MFREPDELSLGSLKDFPFYSPENLSTNYYNPINFPRISFMSSEHGTGGHAGSSEDKDAPQMSLFGDGER